MKILLIEDDVLLATAIQHAVREWHATDVVHKGEDGIYAAVTTLYDLIILDISLPDIDGISVCREIRKQNRQIPILFLTGQLDIDHKIQAFDYGADDYITKPFEKRELLARIRALLRRADQRQAINTLAIGTILIDLENHRVFRKGQLLNLRRKEFDMLVYMARNVDKPVSREKLQSYLWGEEIELLANTIDVHINYLRDKLDKPFNSHLIETVHGVGYKLVSDDKK